MRGLGTTPGVWIWEVLNPQAAAIEARVNASASEQAALEAAPEVVSAVDRFRAATADFWNAYSEFSANAADADALGLTAEYAALNDRAGGAMNYIQRIGQTVSDAWGWGKSTFGLSGLRGGLGFLPAIPIAYAVIAAAIAWVLSITADMVRFNIKMNAVRDGAITPEEAGINAPDAAGSITDMVKYGAVIAALVILAPPILRAMEGRK